MAINTTSYSPNGYVTIAGTSYRFKRYSGGGGGGGSATSDWTSVYGGTLYGGTYFLRTEPDVSLGGFTETSLGDVMSAMGAGVDVADKFSITFTNTNSEVTGNDSLKLGQLYYTSNAKSSLTPEITTPYWLSNLDHMRWTTDSPSGLLSQLLLGSPALEETYTPSQWANEAGATN